MMSNSIKLAILAFSLSYMMNSNALIQEQPIDVNTYITTAKCQNCDLSMVNLNDAMVKMIKQSDNLNYYTGSDLKGADLVGSTFYVYGFSANMQNSNFDGVSASNVDLSNTKLDNSTFINAILEKANFSSSALAKANFSGADLKGATLDKADLTGSNITQGQLSQVSHCQTVLPNGTIATSCTGF